MIRGLTSNRVLILVDGQRLNNARESTDFAGIQPALVNLAEVERIEVLRGPASVQYGSDAIGGVVNIITRKPDLGGQEFKITGDAAYEYASTSDSQQFRASVSGTGEGFSFFVGGTSEDVGNYTAADGAAEDPRYEDYVLSDNVVPNSGMEQTTFNGNFRFLTGDQGVFRVNAEIVRTKNVGFPGFDPATSGIDISFPNFDRDKVALAWESGPVWGLDDIVLSTWYQEIDKESIRNFDFGFFFSNQFTQSVIKSLGFNAQSIADLGAHHLTFGLDFYQDKLHDNALSETSFSPPSNEVTVPDSHQRGLGLYVEDRITLSPRVTLNAGLRGDDFSFVTENDPRYAGEQFDVNQIGAGGESGRGLAGGATRQPDGSDRPRLSRPQPSGAVVHRSCEHRRHLYSSKPLPRLRDLLELRGRLQGALRPLFGRFEYLLQRPQRFHHAPVPRPVREPDPGARRGSVGKRRKGDHQGHRARPRGDLRQVVDGLRVRLP